MILYHLPALLLGSASPVSKQEGCSGVTAGTQGPRAWDWGHTGQAPGRQKGMCAPTVKRWYTI